MTDAILKEMKDKMEKAIDIFHRELAKLRTGRASLSMLDGIKVDYYGTPTLLNQLATMSVPESRLITIQPWDANILSDIEKAIMNSDLGLTPTNDGKLIRISIPQLTEERRKDIVKVAKKVAEECKIAIRNNRRDANEEVKKLEKDKTISQDDSKKKQAQIQEITDKYIVKIDDILKHREKEIMEV
ncbi:MAG: ribosome recycling factor [Deltaproteobacteria bacterium RIFCSPLOWO2_12_FULL_43_16]|nr:MAG: ribosome recycling factor [Deltaproteobacteria bacterium GWA2_43_19]OGQ11367.1 MAG: ribosome recycling factor [Deltaproteobacteria bacterium RIFCSPHIGHO2_02_FULL_43_33]OGQ60496.1 MAG: ribosome recycling factor [Deltaproteobacteria bacterium RIFCSPLOWO2_12_FULL_43_16]HBR17960.1 ribosome recycling factor [Deltaproteobacteria bacterium]